MRSNLGFWPGKRVLITGHTGFKGSWLSLWLSQLGADVAGFALPPNTDPSLFYILRIGEKVSSRFGDVRDLSELREVVRVARPQIFFHMAAQAEVREGFARPADTFETNVMGTAHALETARDAADLRAMVVVTSDKCYRNDGRLTGYREGDPLGGDDPYSCSKAAAELVVSSYRKSFFGASACAIATARAGNVIGGGDWSRDRLVPDVVRAVVERSPLRLRNPGATRPWQHVLDSLAGYLLLAERLWTDGQEFAEAWNFGPPLGESVTVSDLAESIFAAWREARSWAHAPASEPEPLRLAVDASKARERLGWEPRLSPAETIDWTVDWYRAWHQGQAPEKISARQLERYRDRAHVR